MQVTSLLGLWVILALAVCLAGVAGLVEYLLKRRRRHADADHIAQRAQHFRKAVSNAVSVQRATSAFLSTLETSRRTAAATAGQASPDATDLETGHAPAAAKAAPGGGTGPRRPPTGALLRSATSPSARRLHRNPVLRSSACPPCVCAVCARSSGQHHRVLQYTSLVGNGHACETVICMGPRGVPDMSRHGLIKQPAIAACLHR